MMQRILDYLTPRTLGIIALAALPPAALHFYYSLFNLNIPRMDAAQRSTRIAVKYIEGTLTPLDMIQAYFGHITVVRHTLTLLMTILTDWNVALEAYSNFWLATLSYLLILALVFHIDRQMVLPLMIPVSLLTYTVAQNQIWLAGYNAAWFDVEVLFLSALFLLMVYPGRIWTLVLAGVVLFIATFSMGHGFMGWWLALPLILLNHKGRARVWVG
ncbi:MAG: hypothetical protein AAF125_27155, partial [Chloroflexota bacterium]